MKSNKPRKHTPQTASSINPVRRAKTGSSSENVELLQLCSEYVKLERICRDESNSRSDDYLSDIHKQKMELAAGIIDTKPTTLSEFRALARAMFGWRPSMTYIDLEDLNGCDAELIHLLINGLVFTAV